MDRVHACALYLSPRAYEEMYDVAQKLLEYAKENGLEPRGMVRNTYLEGPPQHKDPHKFITQVALPLK